VRKSIFLKGLLLAGLEIQKISVNIFCIVIVLQQTVSHYTKSRSMRLFFIPIKKWFHIFLFCQIIYSLILIIAPTFTPT